MHLLEYFRGPPQEFLWGMGGTGENIVHVTALTLIK